MTVSHSLVRSILVRALAIATCEPNDRWRPLRPHARILAPADCMRSLGDLKPLRPKFPLRANRNCGKKFADLQLGAFLEFDNLDSEAERLPVRV